MSYCDLPVFYKSSLRRVLLFIYSRFRVVFRKKAKLRELIKSKIQKCIYSIDCMVEMPLALKSYLDTKTHCVGLLFLAENLCPLSVIIYPYGVKYDNMLAPE